MDGGKRKKAAMRVGTKQNKKVPENYCGARLLKNPGTKNCGSGAGSSGKRGRGNSIFKVCIVYG